MKLSMHITQRPPAAEKIMRNINFGVAMGLTATAKDGQSAVQGALKDGRFTLRSPWWQPNMKHGIKITAAKRDKLESAVHTSADWLAKHEKGGTHTGRSSHRLAVPTRQFRPPRSVKKIPRGMRPAALIAAGKGFIVKTDRGDVLAITKGKGANQRLEFLYGLERSVRIKKQSMFFEPITKTVKRNGERNIIAGIRKALATMK